MNRIHQIRTATRAALIGMALAAFCIQPVFISLTCDMDAKSDCGAAKVQLATTSGCQCNPLSEMCGCNECECSEPVDQHSPVPAIPSESNESQSQVLVLVMGASWLAPTDSYSAMKYTIGKVPVFSDSAQATCALLSRFTC